jgi:hypothetical protein
MEREGTMIEQSGQISLAHLPGARLDEGIDPDNFVPTSNQPLRDVRPNEASNSCYEDAHGESLAPTRQAIFRCGGPYHRPMQLIELLAALLIAGLILLPLIPVIRQETPVPRIVLGIGVGIGAGLIGALVALVLQADLVPDDIEAIARVPLIAMGIAAVLAFAVWRAARR